VCFGLSQIPVGCRSKPRWWIRAYCTRSRSVTAREKLRPRTGPRWPGETSAAAAAQPSGRVPYVAFYGHFPRLLFTVTVDGFYLPHHMRVAGCLPHIRLSVIRMHCSCWKWKRTEGERAASRRRRRRDPKRDDIQNTLALSSSRVWWGPARSLPQRWDPTYQRLGEFNVLALAIPIGCCIRTLPWATEWHEPCTHPVSSLGRRIWEVRTHWQPPVLSRSLI
jgi:hypothetical protein